MKIFRKFISITTVFTIFISLCLTVTSASAASGKDYLSQLDYIEELIREININSNENDEPLRRALERLFEEDPEFYYSLVNAMLETYDPYSIIVPPGLYDTYYPTGEAYIGTGIIFDEMAGGRFIKAFVNNSPGRKAGLEIGDQVVMVDGVDIRYMDLAECTALIRGAEGEDVTLGVYRGNDPEIKEFTITRQRLSVPNVTFEQLSEKIGYIKVARFGSLIDYFDFSDIYDSLPGLGIDSVIIDLRDNPGGDVNALANMINCVVPDEDIELFELIYRDEEYIVESTGIGNPDIKVTILVNEHSASASEVFAGSLQGLGYAEVVGAVTYGKGYSQYHMEQDDDSVIVMSVSEIILPKYGSYDGKGIPPKYPVELIETTPVLPTLEPLSQDSPVMPSAAYSPRTFALQQRLKLLGFYYGEPDGVYGLMTSRMVESFQHANGLTETGVADAGTLAAVERKIVALKISLVPRDTQFEEAYRVALRMK